MTEGFYSFIPNVKTVALGTVKTRLQFAVFSGNRGKFQFVSFVLFDFVIHRQRSAFISFIKVGLSSRDSAKEKTICCNGWSPEQCFSLDCKRILWRYSLLSTMSTQDPCPRLFAQEKKDIENVQERRFSTRTGKYSLGLFRNTRTVEIYWMRCWDVIVEIA